MDGLSIAIFFPKEGEILEAISRHLGCLQNVLFNQHVPQEETSQNAEHIWLYVFKFPFLVYILVKGNSYQEYYLWHLR